MGLASLGVNPMKIIEPVKFWPHLFRQVWRKVRPPNPGTGYYPYQSLALVPETPIGPAVAARNRLVKPLPGTAQDYVTLNAPIAGLPIVAGQMAPNRLYSPEQGIRGNKPLQQNIPYPVYEVAPAGRAI